MEPSSAIFQLSNTAAETDFLSELIEISVGFEWNRGQKAAGSPMQMPTMISFGN